VPPLEALEEELLRILCRSSRPLTVEEIVEAVGWSGDRRPLRRALADLVRRGLVDKIPDYEGRVMRFRARGGGCGGEA